MAALRHSLQRELFLPGEERLVGLVHVTSMGKKKQVPCFLCAAVTTDTNIGAYIYKVKKTEKNTYKKKQSWPLQELKRVDGKDENKETAEFDLHFDKVYHYVASNAQERLIFFAVLSKLCNKYLPKQSPAFINMPRGILDSGNRPTTAEANAAEGNLEAAITEDEYQALSEKEERDLEWLLQQTDNALSNAEVFMEQLGKDLSVLDGANIYSLMGSEAQVAQLLNLLEAAEQEAARIEAQLDSYENVLQQARVAMATVGEKNVSLETANRNNRLLLDELNSMISQLDVPHAQQVTLADADLTTGAGLSAAIKAAKTLQRAMNAEISPGLEKMVAVQEQRRRFDKWRAKFSLTVSRHLNNLFIHLGNDLGDTGSQGSRSSGSSQLTVSLAKHGSLHTQLQAFAPLMHWLKAMDRRSYDELLKVYKMSIGKLYERDLKQFFDEARSKVVNLREKKSKSSESGSEGSNRYALNQLKGPSSSGVSTVSSSSLPQPQSQGLLGLERDLWPIDLESGERKKLDELLECALSELEPVCLAEQEFCVGFFSLEKEVSVEDALKSPEKTLNEEMRKMMGKLFAVLEPELISFLGSYEKVDAFSSLYILVRMSQHVLTATDAGSFLSVTFGSVLVQVKRAFDRFFQAQLRSIEEAKPPKKSKCGILPFVSNFEEFANITESIFRNSDRRVDVDKWYVRLIRAMFEAVPRLAAEHFKTPPEVVKMENYHYLNELLSQLKITVLESERKEAKQKYTEALRLYVTQYFGRPLEKLNLFFERVQAKVAHGVKESEIGYQVAFSKQELRKVIAMYPGREVKRGLEALYKKVDKHLSEEGHLNEVVWREMQEEFINQHKTLEDMIQRCYPGALITLEFSISDVLQYFTDIARSH